MFCLENKSPTPSLHSGIPGVKTTCGSYRVHTDVILQCCDLKERVCHFKYTAYCVSTQILASGRLMGTYARTMKAIVKRTMSQRSYNPVFPVPLIGRELVVPA